MIKEITARKLKFDTAAWWKFRRSQLPFLYESATLAHSLSPAHQALGELS